MALDFLSKFKKGGAGAGGGNGGNAGQGAEPLEPDPGKAEKFFNHARTSADSRQYDYAIHLYVSGLRFDPGNYGCHLELYEVAKRRKVNGGKPASRSEKRIKTGDKHPIDLMLHEEMCWAKDPLNSAHALNIMEHAVVIDATHEQLNLAEFAFWVGEAAMELCKNTKKPDKADFLKLYELFKRLGSYEKAIENCRIAIQLDPDDRDLDQMLKDIVTERTISEGGYGTGKEGGFVQGVKDMDQQMALENQDAITKTQSVIDSNIARRRQEYEEDRQDLDRMAKLVAVLREKKDEATDQEAIDLLDAAWQQTQQYKYRALIGDIRISQFRRRQHAAEKALKKDPNDAQAKAKLKDIAKQRNTFELQEYSERAENYPTDMRIRFELGVRYFAAKQIDEAIGQFQQAEADPKHKAASQGYLGRCFASLDYMDEAVAALRKGIEAHGDPGDKLGMELQYLLMGALERSATQSKSLDQAKEAQQTASQILQKDINYRDIRERMNQLKQLVAQLQSDADG